ncbi:hypothetical protein HBB16_04280 [Pseudonocardia sp. MCCB 268]|nr:hypothetical protein [Pseudonocardia cytotoxica]
MSFVLRRARCLASRAPSPAGTPRSRGCPSLPVRGTDSSAELYRAADRLRDLPAAAPADVRRSVPWAVHPVPLRRR